MKFPDSFKWLILAAVNLAAASAIIYFLLVALAEYKPIVTQQMQDIRSAMRHEAVWEADRGWNTRRKVQWCSKCSRK